MMELPLNTRVLRVGSVDEVPIAPRTAVVSPARNRGVVGENCVERDVGLVVIVEVTRPLVDLLLSRGIPRHLAAEGISFALPYIRALAHHAFKLCSLIREAFFFQVVEQAQKDCAFHLSEAGVIGSI